MDLSQLIPICTKLRLRRILPDRRVLFHGSEGNWDYHLLLMVGVVQKTHCCKDCKPWMVILSLTTELLMDTRSSSGQHWYPSLCCDLGTCGTWWRYSLNMMCRRSGSSSLPPFHQCCTSFLLPLWNMVWLLFARILTRLCLRSLIQKMIVDWLLMNGCILPRGKFSRSSCNFTSGYFKAYSLWISISYEQCAVQINVWD